MSSSTSSDGEGSSGSEEDTDPALPADGEDEGSESGGDEGSESSSDGEYIAENQPWWRFWIAR